jgi:multidrug resistance protein MdtO
MARPAAESAVARWLGLLAPLPGRLEFALRLALICTATTLVAEIYGTPEPALTAYIVFFLNRPDRATSLLLGVAMAVVITVVIALVLGIALVVVDEPPWRVASMAVLSLGLLFLVSASKLRPVGGTIALIVAYVLDLLGSIPTGELGTRGLLYGWLFVAMPAGVSIVVNLLVAPAPRRLVERALAQRLRIAVAVLRGTGDPAAPARLLQEGDAELQARLRLAAAGRTSPPEDIAALRHAIDASVALLSALDFIARTPGVALPAPLRAAAADTLARMAAILDAGGYPVDVALPAEAESEAPKAPLAASAWDTLRDAIERFAVPAEAASGTAPAKARGFFLPDAFTNPLHQRYAVKTTAAAMACYLLYSTLDWPGIHTCMITCYIVSLGTLADSVEKLALRIAGCLVGAALGLATMIFVIPSVTSPVAFLAIVFAGALASAWVAAGSPRISYVGFQMAFAFFLCVIQGTGPSFDMVVARDRVIGILIGNVMVYAVSTLAWPVSVAGRIDAGLLEAVRLMRRLAGAPDASARRRLASQSQAALGAVAADIDIAAYEPGSVRPAAAWLASRTQAVARAAALLSPLLLLAERDPGVGAAIDRRLARLASEPVPASPATYDAAAAPLRRLVDGRAADLEAALAPLSPRDEGAIGAPA